MSTRLLPLASLCLSLALAGEMPKPRPTPLPEPLRIGALPKVICESSGLCRSRRYPEKQIFWTHNDSGDSARIFAINGAGELIRDVPIPNAKNVDWEEISMDDRGRIVIGDIGDNSHRRPFFCLYRLPEPDALNPAVPADVPQTFRFRYPQGQGPFDAEAFVVRGNCAWLFTKELDRARCYRLALPEQAPAAAAEPAVAEFLGETRTFSIATAASLSNDDRRLALLNYLSVVVIDLPEAFESIATSAEGLNAVFAAPRRARMGFLGQTEGICWDGDDLLISSENGDDMHLGREFGELWRVKTK